MVRHPAHHGRGPVAGLAGLLAGHHAARADHGGQARARRAATLMVYDVEQRRLIDAEITRRSIEFMERQAQAGKPFFAYVTLTQPHLPTLPNPAFAGKTGNGDWADMLAEMDHNVGQMLDAVDRLGHPRQHHRHLHQRQRAGIRQAVGRLGRAVARPVLHRLEGRRPRAVHDPLAGQGAAPAGSATRSSTTSTCSRRSPASPAPRCRRIGPIDGVDQTDFLTRQDREVGT